ncbi:MAG: hypothetical protein K8S55_16105 [Phycisphaerae bacterium]|nr:hypothetical protein [Phycisphaerae bacterium]
MKRLAKSVLAGVVVGVLGIGWGWLTCGFLFNWVYRLAPTNIWVKPDDMPFDMMAVTSVLFAILLAIVYSQISKSLPGRSVVVKGLWFGVIVWLVGALPGIYSMLLYTTFAYQVVIYWLVNALVAGLWKGVIIALIVGKDKS